MDDKYLDNAFREKLKLPQQHDFEESAWLDLESRLEEEPNRRIIPWRWIAAAGILLPMLMTSFYFYYELRQTEQQLAKLETRINKLLNKETIKSDKDATNKKEALALNDAFTEESGTARQSTTPKVESIETITPNQSKTLKSTTTNIEAQTSTLEPASNGQVPVITTKGTDTKNYTAAIAKKEETTIIPTLSPLAKAENDTKAANAFFLNPKNEVATNGFQRRKVVPNLNHLNMIYSNNLLVMEESVWDRATEYFFPVGFEVSVGSFAGTQIPTATPLATIQNEKPYFNNQGVEVAANFINGVDLIVGINKAGYSYTTTTIGQDFPNAEPNNVGDIFNNVTVTEDVVQVPVGLKYNFGNYDDVFAPFVEIGGIAKRSIQIEHKFEYLPLSRGERPYRISPPKTQQETTNFAMNTASVAGGLKWNPNLKNRILDNMVIQAETFVNADFETEKTAWRAGVGVSATYVF